VIPKTLGSVASLKARAEKSLAVKEEWRSLLEDTYRYFCPQREVWDFYNAGEDKMNHIFDSTGQVALKEFANRMMGSITPQATIWATMVPGIDIPQQYRKDPDLTRSLQEANEILFGYINNSNFYTIMGEAYLDLGIGTAGITVDEGDLESPLVYGMIDQSQVGYEESHTGLIENIYRKKKHKARNIKKAYPGGSFNQEITDMIENSPNAEVTFTECMVKDEKTGEYWIVVIYDDDEVWSNPQGTANPWIAFRWQVIPNEVRGRGPALDALPDVKTLNKIQEFALQKAALDLAGLWTGQDDGIFNPYTVQVAPGVVIPVSTNSTTNPTLQRLDTGAPLQLAQFEIDKLQTNVKTNLYNDLRDPTGAVRSATEVTINQRELAQRIGSNFGRIQNEALSRILNSTYQILRRLGKVPPVNIDGREVAIKFISPLARAQDAEDVQVLQNAVATTAQLAGPEAIPMEFKVENFGNFIAHKFGMDADLVRTDSEKQEKMQQMAQLAQMQAGAAGGESIQ